MSSHILGEVDLLATRIGIVHRGRLVEELDSDALEAHRDRRLEVEGRDLGAAEDGLAGGGLLAAAAQVPTGDSNSATPRPSRRPTRSPKLLVAAGTPPTHLAIARESLEEHFMRLTTATAGAGVTGLVAAVATEFLKSRRSRVPWGVAIGFSIAPLVMGLFMVILKDPEAARSLGLLGAKAQLTAGTADWPTYWSLLGQAVDRRRGSILFAFLTAWVFGREFADRTVRGLLATPTSRRTIVIAKALVVAAWGTAISAWILALGLVIGGLIGLPGWSASEGPATVASIALAAVLTIALQGLAAFFAGVGHGYIAPLAWAVAMVAAAQVLAVLGWGAWFPWAVPAIARVEPVALQSSR